MPENADNQPVADGTAYLNLRLCYSRPIEVGDFVSTFTSLRNQFERFIRDNFPDLKDDTEICVKEVRKGSADIDFVAFLGGLYFAMEHSLVIEQFVKLYGGRLVNYFNPNGKDESASRSDLKDFMDAVTAIARDPNASSTLSAVSYEDGKKEGLGTCGI